MANSNYATEAVIARALKAVRKEGYPIGGVEVERDGTIRILTEAQVKPSASAYDSWKASKGK